MKTGPQHLARRTAVMFWIMTAFFVAQMTWWIVFQLSSRSEDLKLRTDALQHERLRATEEWQQYAEHWTDSVRTSWRTLRPDELRGQRISQLQGWNEIVSWSYAGREVVARKRPGSAMTVARLEVGLLGRAVVICVDSSFVGGFLAREFPSLTYSAVPDTGRSVSAAVSFRDLDVSQDALDELAEEHHRRVRMFVGEGSFFILLILVGAVTIHRTLRRGREFEHSQQNFLAAVTHELKAPLASIRLFAETLTTRELPENKRHDCLNRITQDVDRLQDLVDDTLNAGFFSRRSFHPRLEESDLSETIVAYAEMYRHRTTREKIALTVDVAPGAYARIDYHHLRRAVGSVIENSIKYSRPGAPDRQIKVRLGIGGDRAILTVTDNGIGLAPEDQKRAFDRFYRAGDEMTRRVSGSGLGLYLTREIIKAHKGRISLSSPGLGKGTTVEIHFPLTRVYSGPDVPNGARTA